MSIPLVPIDQLEPPPKEIDFHPRLLSPRLLVVEDDPQMIPLLTRALRLLDPDIQLDWATSAKEGRGALASGHYDAVLADFVLEDSDSGFSLYEDSRTLQPDARFAMMSALPISPPEQSCGLLRKPFDVLECRRFLEGLLLGTD